MSGPTFQGLERRAGYLAEDRARIAARKFCASVVASLADTGLFREGEIEYLLVETDLLEKATTFMAKQYHHQFFRQATDAALAQLKINLNEAEKALRK